MSSKCIANVKSGLGDQLYNCSKFLSNCFDFVVEDLTFMTCVFYFCFLKFYIHVHGIVFILFYYIRYLFTYK